jgi:hypothetical protein
VFFVASAIVLAGCAGPAGNRGKDFTAGKEGQFYQYGYANAECKVTTLPKVTLSKKPQHGTFRAVYQPISPNFQQGHLKHCNSKKLQGIALYYKPDAGYKGDDELEYRVEWPTNETEYLRFQPTTR